MQGGFVGVVCVLEKRSIKINIIFNRMSDIECVFQSMSGKGSIYISNFAAAQDIQLLQSKGIRAILSVARSGFLQHNKEEVPFYLYLPAQDHEDYEIYKFFNQTYEFIEQARKNTNVLVHCMAGVSRSVTIVTAYLLKKFKCSLGEVIRMLQRKRSKINPNKGFLEQLKKYAHEEGLKCSFGHEEAQKDKPLRPKESDYSLTNPLAKLSTQLDERSTFERTIREDISEYSKKSEEFKPFSPNKPNSAEEDFVLRPRKSGLNEQSVALKKRYSCDNYSPDKKIEEKIMKVREKIQIKKSLTLKRQPEDCLQSKDSLRRLLQQKKHSGKQLSEYFSLCHRTKEEPVPLADKKQESELLYVDMCETDGLVLSKGYRMETRQSKLQPRKRLDKSIC